MKFLGKMVFAFSSDVFFAEQGKNVNKRHIKNMLTFFIKLFYIIFRNRSITNLKETLEFDL